MSNRFLISVAAAALIAGTGLANAQGMGKEGGGGAAGGGATQQSAPGGGGSPSAAPMNRESGGAMKGAESAPKGGEGGMKGGEGGMKAGANDKGPAGAKSAEDNKMQGEKSKSMSSETKDTKGGKDMKAEDGKADSKNGNMNADSKNGNMTKGADSKGADGKGADGKTTGNAATSATAAPPAEKRAQISSAMKSEKIEEVTNVNFNISVGTRVPASVRYHPLPPRIVEIYPEWRGYDVIFVRGQYIVLRPETHEIVYIIEG